MNNLVLIMALLGGVEITHAAETTVPKHTIRIQYNNGSTTTGRENFNEAEHLLIEEAKKTCGADAQRVVTTDLKFSISGCGGMNLLAAEDKEVSSFACYPLVIATAEIQCLVQ